MFGDLMEYEVIQHYGVKGMHWGVITKKASNSKIGRRFRRTKAGAYFYGRDLAGSDAEKRYMNIRLKKAERGLSREDIAKGRRTVARVGYHGINAAVGAFTVSSILASSAIPYAGIPSAVASLSVGSLAIKRNNEYFGRYVKEYKKTGDISYHKPKDVN